MGVGDILIGGEQRGALAPSPRRAGLRCAPVFILLILASLSSWAGASSAHPPYVGFPLAKDVRGRSYTVLGEGNYKSTLWGAFASRVGTTGRSRSVPCISVAKITWYGLYGHVSNCGYLPSDSTRESGSVFSVISMTDIGALGHARSSAFFSAAVPADISKVSIRFKPGGLISKRTQLLSGAQQKEAQLDPFRYVAFVMPKGVCVRRISGFDRGDSQVFSEPGNDC